MITTTLWFSCHWALVPFCLRKKRLEKAFLTNRELSRNRTEKQIMPFKTTVNGLINNIWGFFSLWLFWLNVNKMNLFGISFILYFLKLSYGSRLQQTVVRVYYIHKYSQTKLKVSGISSGNADERVAKFISGVQTMR